MKNRKGFTLIELLLVVAILAFLIAIIVVASREISKDSKKRSMDDSLRTLKTAIETYYIQENAFPTETGFATELLIWASNQPGAIDAIPKDIFADGNPDVNYDLYTGAGKPTYVSWSVGPDTVADISGAGDDVLTFVGTDEDDDIFVTNATGKVYK